MPATTERFEFRNAAGQSLAARLELPAREPLAWGLFAHCFTCGKDSHAATRIARALSDRGFAVLRFDFTGLGGSEGDFENTDFSSNVSDLVAAAEALEARGEAPALLVGHSLGGAAVIEAARRLASVKAVATLGAPADPAHLRELLTAGGDHAGAAFDEDGRAEVSLGGRSFGLRREFLDDLDRHAPTDTLAALDAALLVLHAPDDDIVPIEHGERLFAAAHQPRAFVSLDGADHLLSDPADAAYVATLLAAWAARHVGAPTQAGDRPRLKVRGLALPRVPEGQVLVSEGTTRHHQRIIAGHHALAADEPESLGGGDSGPTPYDLLLAGLGACTSMTLRMYADRKGWPLEHVSVRLSHERIHAEDCADCEAGEGKVSRIERVIELTGHLDGEQRVRLLEIADRCPVHRTITEPKDLVTRLAEPRARGDRSEGADG